MVDEFNTKSTQTCLILVKIHDQNHSTHLATDGSSVDVCKNYLHPTTWQDADCTWLQETAQQILHDMQEHLHLEDMIGNIDIELMTKATKYIQQFITRSHDHIWDHNQVTAKWAKLQMHDIY